MTNTDGLTIAQLRDLAEKLRRPDGFVTPFNAVPLPKTRAKLVEFIAGFEQRAADSRAIERQAR